MTVEALAFHYLTNDAVSVEAASLDGSVIGDGVTVSAGLGTAWRPPTVLTPCAWLTPAGATREFVLPIHPSAAPIITAGVYRVWFLLSVPPLAPLIRADGKITIYGSVT